MYMWKVIIYNIIWYFIYLFEITEDQNGYLF